MPEREPTRIDLSPSPTREEIQPRLDLVRTPPAGTLQGICLSQNIIGTEIHFWPNRSRPCTLRSCKWCQAGMGDKSTIDNKIVHRTADGIEPCTAQKCNACEALSPFRWKGYFIMLSEKTSQIAIVEITASVLDARDEYWRVHGQLRGARVCLSRRNKKANGAIKMSLMPSGRVESSLPTCPNLQYHLARIWDSAGRHSGPKENEDSPTGWDLELNAE